MTFLQNDSDTSWERIGKADPYWGVLTDDRFRSCRLSVETKREFWDKGVADMARVLEGAERHFGPLDGTSALEFGCGVGRLLIPLSDRFSEVTGVDVSTGMREEARRNCVECGNVDIVSSLESLAGKERRYSFMHTYMVLQHIPVRRGEAIIRQLLGFVKPGGIAAIHVPFRQQVSALRRFAGKLRIHVDVLNIPINLVQRRRWNEPLMQMNYYSMDRLFGLFHELGIHQCVVEMSEFRRCLSSMVYLQVPFEGI